ncbi:MAG: glycosyltransferase, partial [Chloroflexota bacterium]
HNPRLAARVRAGLPDVVAVENQEPRGLAGARNAGIAIARGSVVAFLDDDALAAADWLEQLLAPYADPLVCGVGGAIEPAWSGRRPRWFPPEFDWVVGCTYRGMPNHAGPVRNLIGANMSFRREVFEVAGSFRSGMGRLGTRPLGCEETELCIRARRHRPQWALLYEPRARVRHRVPASRARWTYFRARCYAEGLSKARVSEFVGAKDGLASERMYTLQILPRGVARGLTDTLKGDLGGLGRAGAIIGGLSMTSAGYVTGKASELIALGKNGTRRLGTNEAQNFKPLRILEVELGRPLSAVPSHDSETGRTYTRALALVRLHGRPLGTVELRLDADEVSGEDQARAIWRSLHEEICAHLGKDGLSEPVGLGADGLQTAAAPKCIQERDAVLADAPFASIVVATHDRAADLAVSLRSLLALDYPNFEIIVVDNAPSSSATADFMRATYGDAAMIRYVREDRPGLGRAHNRGLEDVRGEIVAFTDDDVVVDRHWLTELVKGFSVAANVGCVTGMIFPRELQTQAQLWIEQHGGFGKGYARRIFDLDENHPKSRLYPYAAGAFGSGANMAFRTPALRAMGGFDPALGAGSP